MRNSSINMYDNNNNNIINEINDNDNNTED